MNTGNAHVAQLLSRYLEGNATEAEVLELFDWLRKAAPDAAEQLNSVLESFYRESMQYPSGISAEASERILQKISRSIDEPGDTAATPVTGIGYQWKKWLAAAAVIACLVVTAFLLNNKGKQETGVAKTVPPAPKDIKPGGNKAVLTLSDGSTIVLDSAKEGLLSGQGKTDILKVNSGELAYTTKAAGTDEIFFNTIATPKGGQYHIVLADGTHVWLNAASSLRFPTAFKEGKRTVVLTGEAYFEVAHNPSMPFVVENGALSVLVLGTHFNVNAYSDENLARVTLLEGSVRVNSRGAGRTIKPGQQAQVGTEAKINLVPDADVENAVAWKNGQIQFKGADIETVMRQLARWYDVDIEYATKPDDLFYAEIPRITMLSDVLKALELTGKVHFRIEGRKVIVTT